MTSSDRKIEEIQDVEEEEADCDLLKQPWVRRR